MKFKLVVILLGAVVMLAGCMRSAMDTRSLDAAAAPPSAVQALITLTPQAAETVETDPAAPVLLMEHETAAGPLYLIRYAGPQGTCVALTFDTQTLAVNRCGAFSGAGVGFVDTLTDPTGQAVRAAYGLALQPTISAIAIEFAGGSNGPAVVSDGGYLLVLSNGQTPTRATAIDQYGYLVGQWRF